MRALTALYDCCHTSHCCCCCHTTAIVGADCKGHALQSATHDQLISQGLAWSRHVKETWQVMVAAGAYIIISVVFQVRPVLRAIAAHYTNICNRCIAHAWTRHCAFATL
jgi:hypothetical protein